MCKKIFLLQKTLFIQITVETVTNDVTYIVLSLVPSTHLPEYPKITGIKNNNLSNIIIRGALMDNDVEGIIGTLLVFVINDD